MENNLEFISKARPRAKSVEKEKSNTFDRINALYEGRKLTLLAFKSGIFPMKQTQAKGINIFIAKQLLQKWSISFAKVKAHNTSENLLNKICYKAKNKK